ncbi:putative PAS/PAC sensor protein [Desulfosarcina variabilis str. Montpellier]|uniref:PAS domain S-box protein n=1 Tax=Desulfosarcina variabilis TaxID=2300 RepID=UPI003AFAC460
MSDIETRIKKLENINQLLTENIFDAVWVIDIQTLTFKYITPSIERLSGYRADEYIGMALKERMPIKVYEELVNELNQSLLQLKKVPKPIHAIEVEMIHKNGTVYWVEIFAKLIMEKDEPIKIVGVSRDITERKKLEFGQEEMIQRLNDALIEKQKLTIENKLLRELLPICSGCKRVRDENDRWWPLEIYVEYHTNSKITHTICPDCKDIIYKDFSR